ncbi:D-alanyl-D-alanine carboxypeptidase [Streptomyces sp. NRRL F-2580]|uniref:D-alanyl-D-alanine carboxypeptidase n=1 Tax=Streptomyces sp. NRRL F-2580 TaxID=1463841 RepID=UPI001F3259D3|nr:serine hydrolase [Streptomyces sp. NRRL F-2580]
MEAEAEGERMAEANAGAKAGAEAEGASEAGAEASVGAKAEAGAGTKAGVQGMAEAEADIKAKPEAKAGVEPETTGAGAEAGTGAEARGKVKAGVTAGAGAGSRVEAAVASEAGAKAAVEAERVVDRAGEGATERRSALATPEAGGPDLQTAREAAEATAGPKGDPGGAAAPGREATAEIDDVAEPEVKAAARSASTADGATAAAPANKIAVEADTAVKPVAEANARPEAAAGRPEATGPAKQAAPEADTNGKAGPGSEAEGAREVGAEAEAKAKANIKARAEAEGAATAGPKATAGRAGATPPANPTAPEADNKANTKAKAEPQGDAKTGPKATAGRAGATPPANPTAPEAGGVVKAVAEAKAEAQGAAKAGPAATAGRAGATGSADLAAPEAEAKVDTEAEAEAKGGAAREAGGGPGGAGAGGPTDEGDAGQGAVGAADETQVLVVPKPPRGDGAPKVPSWARQGEAEADSERTSQFVALKPLDVAAPAAAEPKAEPRVRPQPPEASAPLPPLDLLAELTNTAPPPETPRRTAVRRVKVWTPVLLLLAGAYVGAQMLRPLPAPQMVSAETNRTVDGQFSIPWPGKGQGAVHVVGSGDLGTFGEQKPVPTASVAKVMTAYVVLKGHPLRMADPGPDITVDAKTVADGKAEHESRIEGLTAGQKFSQQDMLKMLMIPSGNNVARLLARWDTGSDAEAAFVAKMNATAKELGMTNTTYTDPSGLDAGTVSTAADQLKLAETVMKDEVFRSIVALPNATIKGLSTPLDNNNDLLNSSIRGIKTGSSTPAGGALMWAAYKTIDNKDQLILGTLMDQHVDGPDLNGANSLILVQDNSKKIIEAVRGALASAPVIRKGQPVGYLEDGLGGRMPLVATKDLNVIGVPGQQLKLSLLPGASPLPHTAKAGTEVATLTVGEGDGAKSVPVAVQKDMAEPSFGTRMTRMR